MSSTKGLRERLADGEIVLAAEGFLFEMERRGYLKAGPFVPECVLEHPDLVAQLSDEFVHAGSDVVLAFTYYGHREKLKLVNRQNDLEALNRKALEIAKGVAAKHGKLFAANICNSTTYDPAKPDTAEECQRTFKEQVLWAVEANADFMVAETYFDVKEAQMAIDAVKQYGQGMPMVVCFAPTTDRTTRDGVPMAEACRLAEAAGADVVGLNCGFGPNTIIPEMRKVREAVKIPIACLPSPYRTTEQDPMMQSLILPNGQRAFFEDLDYFLCKQSDFDEFGKACLDIGIQYVGICCGNSSRYFRRLAEAVGRQPPASRYSANMNLHFVYGDKERFSPYQTQVLRSMKTPSEMQKS